MRTPDYWQNRFPAFLLLPLAALFGLLAAGRRLAYRRGWLRSERLAVPLVVIGNLTAGGAGKTPTTLYLAQALSARGLHVGIISRGYGGQVQGVAEVDCAGSARQFGDEPLLLARRSGCPVYVGRDRIAAGRALLAAHPSTELILCDDGLQHYRLQRDLELVVIDGARGFQNGWLLPAGPLREPLSRLQQADAVVINGTALTVLPLPLQLPRFDMQLVPATAYRLDAPAEQRPLSEFANQPLAALAGIAHPQRFFATLRAAGLQFSEHAFPDHYGYQPTDLAPLANQTVLTTEKDAVKLAGMGGNIWVLPVTAQLTPDLADWLLQRLPLK